jgi:hypothetical protein
MNTKTFCLSKKWKEMGMIDSEPMYLEKDVKEFIRLLKVEVNKSIPKLHGYNPIIINHIDKLAGDKLI